MTRRFLLVLLRGTFLQRRQFLREMRLEVRGDTRVCFKQATESMPKINVMIGKRRV